jgi:hypothetical protein
MDEKTSGLQHVGGCDVPQALACEGICAFRYDAAMDVNARTAHRLRPIHGLCVWSYRSVPRGTVRAEQPDRRSAHSRRKMHDAGVVADDERATPEDRSGVLQRRQL